jgi:plastocyanin
MYPGRTLEIQCNEGKDMSKSLVAAIVVVVLAVAGGFAYVATRNPKTIAPENTPVMPMSNNNQPATSGTTPSATSSVTIQNFAFSPAAITVKKGTTVTWTNKDSTTHTVTETDGQKGPDSGNLANGKTYSFTFDTVGTFKYHCAIHPDMLGTVTVTE